MAEFKSYRKGSNIDWGREQDRPLSIEQINCGAILRIADAVEAMAKRHTELMAARDYYERRCREERLSREAVERRVKALRGVITRMKRAKGAA